MSSTTLTSLAVQCMIESSMHNSFFNEKMVALVTILSGSTSKKDDLKVFIIRFLEDISRLKIENHKDRFDRLAKECNVSKAQVVEALEFIVSLSEIFLDENVRKVLVKALTATSNNASDAIKKL